jgi:CheY-like chemotaxis protein
MALSRCGAAVASALARAGAPAVVSSPVGGWVDESGRCAHDVAKKRAATDGPSPRPWRWEPKRNMAQILLIDDEEPVRLALSALLRVTGHEVIAAANGEEGLELFQRQAFDLVVTDLIMPKKDGRETIAALRRLRPGLKIIAMYGGGRLRGSSSPVTAESLGADRLLAKPLTLAELQAAVADVLKLAPEDPGRP